MVSVKAFVSFLETAMVILAQKNYPYAIFRACSELPYTPAFQEMPDGFIRIVLRIVQKINLARPFSEIFASRLTLAQESGKSLDSVHRAVGWLEREGFVQRERKASNGLRGSKSPLVPTLRFLLSLGLVDPEGKPICTQSDTELFCPKRTGEDQKQNVSRESSETQERGPGEFVRVGKVCVPADLAWLCGKGLSAFAVLALMKSARAAQQRLSDVVKASSKYLQSLQKNQLYAYLTALLRSGRDFSASSSESEKISEESRQAAYIREKAENLAGQKFLSSAGETAYSVEEGGGVKVTKYGKHAGMMVFDQRFLDAIESGKLRRAGPQADPEQPIAKLPHLEPVKQASATGRPRSLFFEKIGFYKALDDSREDSTRPSDGQRL